MSSPFKQVKKFVRYALLSILVLLGFISVKRTLYPGLNIKNKKIEVGVALFSNISDVFILSREVKRIKCHEPGCLLYDAKKILENEYFRYSGNRTTFNFDIRIPDDGEIKYIENPDSITGGFALLYDLFMSFWKKDMNYFSKDMRLFINIILKSDRDQSESSLGSTQGRVGVVEWQVSKTDSYIWNLTKTLHEIGHMLGARDKYLASRKSKYPEGYVNPEFGVNRPQIYTEIMSGTRPINPFTEIEPVFANELRFGIQSAREMGWTHEKSLETH